MFVNLIRYEVMEAVALKQGGFRAPGNVWQ